ncbi:MAG: DegT/DnrJ/EryC1/StrS family aminotransferase [Methanobacteriaceae archaeon]|nr:DegT/DnrJ/EryC1/StrS family aminotransferase [Methanobacteriaceae archaeon]OPY24101.1 MAG: putative aspartate aminotransferase 2 [Methanobacterium sp. PtaU1.Bin097]
MIPIAQPLISDEEIDEVVKVLKSGFIAQGPKVAEFEEKFAEYIGVEHAVATTSGTTALHLALLSLGIEKGDEVITTPFSFAATANSILFTGATPVFADINSQTYNINPQKIQEAITDKTKAIMPVHLYGQPANMGPIRKIAEEHNLWIIEDAAQAHGAQYQDQMVGSLGDMACFSFYPTKNMTTGEGGMITTDSDELADVARMLRSHGEGERYNHTILGYNFRMTDIAAAIGLVQLKRLDHFTKSRIENAEYLTTHINTIEGITPPFVLDKVKHVFHQYTVRVENGKRDDVKDFLTGLGIGTGVHYPKTIYDQKLYQDLGIGGNCPQAEKAASQVLSLPVHPGLSTEDLTEIVDLLEEASEKFF